MFATNLAYFAENIMYTFLWPRDGNTGLSSRGGGATVIGCQAR